MHYLETFNVEFGGPYHVPIPPSVLQRIDEWIATTNFIILDNRDEVAGLLAENTCGPITIYFYVNDLRQPAVKYDECLSSIVNGLAFVSAVIKEVNIYEYVNAGEEGRHTSFRRDQLWPTS